MTTNLMKLDTIYNKFFLNMNRLNDGTVNNLKNLNNKLNQIVNEKRQSEQKILKRLDKDVKRVLKKLKYPKP